MLSVVLETKTPESAPIAAIDQQLLLLASLKQLLDIATRLLRSGDTTPWLALGPQIKSNSQELLALLPQLACVVACPETQQKRRQLLLKLAQQRALCCSMLRRWRRSLSLRRQLLGLRGGTALYTDSLGPMEQR